MSVRNLYWTLAVLFCLTSCNDGKRYRDEDPAPVVVSVNPGLASITEFQETINSEFRDPETSPLRGEQLREFPGLQFFEADTSYQVRARLVRTPEALPFEMPTTTDRLAMERKYGMLYFELAGQPFSLEVYQSPELILEPGYENYLFLPFTDETNGKETYEGGRYIDLRIPRGDSLLLDFNRAYNPYCAYNAEYSCPIVPKVNHLPLPVRAGVRAYRK